MKRIGDTALSPDGRLMALVVTSYDMEKNSGNADLWLLSTNDDALRQLTFFEKFDGAPRWKPDGSGLAFLSDRSGTRQIFFLSLAGGEAKQMTHLPVAVEDFIWTPDGERFVFVASVFPDAKDLDETARQLKEQEQSKSKPLSDRLMYRVFDHWTEGCAAMCSSDRRISGQDLTAGYDAPPVDMAEHATMRSGCLGTGLCPNQDPVAALYRPTTTSCSPLSTPFHRRPAPLPTKPMTISRSIRRTADFSPTGLCNDRALRLIAIS